LLILFSSSCSVCSCLECGLGPWQQLSNSNSLG
jgi:hypothetical protein